jgi:formylglycine-generating enzyme required for sulfatase activity
MSESCCTPSRKPSSELEHPHQTVEFGGRRPHSLVTVPAGRYGMGDESDWSYPGDGEGPDHEVVLPAFQIDQYAVSNQRFAEFVDDTGWQTDAERFGWSFVFGGLLPDDFPPTRGVSGTPWWRQVMESDWRHPEGPHSDIADRLDHPVVHVSWNDAQAYCTWSGTRLPSEAEWEAAARGAMDRQPFPWGDELEPGGQHRMNVFQGDFPGGNSGADGFVGTAPVDAFPPNGYGLHNTTGNVWEWCADWLDVNYYAVSPIESPTGPPAGSSRVQRGGSYLCHASYCRRYRVSARFGSEPETSTGNVGFRVAADLPASG